MRFLTGCIMILISTVHVRAATYYVDYDGGSDGNNGTSAGTAWQHVPGDLNASGNADITLSAGDVVLFRGGVHYKGTFSVNASGTSGNPITYKGDGWGDDKAVLEGAEELTGWTRCSSADDCGGNANWANIWYTTVASPPFSQATEMNLYQDDRLLAVSQYPNPEDPFFMGRAADMMEYESATTTTVTDAELADIGADLVGMYAYVYAATNQVYFSRITAFDAGSNTITFGAIAKDPASRYAIANGLNDIVLDREGEVAFDESTNRLYVWPHDGADLNAVPVRISEREGVIDLGSRSHIHFEGLSAERYMGQFINGSTCAGIEMRDCEVKYFRSSGISNSVHISYATDCVFEDNFFTMNARLRSIVMNQSGDNVSYRNNRIIKVGRSPLVFHACDNSEMVGNYVENCTGVHSNGLTVYGLNGDLCSTVLIKDNIVIHSNVSLTFQICEGITIVNNLFNSDGTGYAMACWGSSTTERVTAYHNSLVNSGSRYGFFILPEGSPSLPNSVVKNNIIDGMQDFGGEISHNLYTMYAPSGQVSGKTGDIINFDKGAIFTDWTNGDWTLAAGSPAVDAGTDVGIDTDMNGTARTVGTAPDLGCYEYDPSAVGDEVGADGLAVGGLVIPNPVRAVAGALMVRKALIERGAGAVRLFTMDGRPVHDVRAVRAGCHLLGYEGGMRRIIVVE